MMDWQMPEMNGTEFLAEARKFYPEAKKVLLTAYADTDAAITSINDPKDRHDRIDGILLPAKRGFLKMSSQHNLL